MSVPTELQNGSRDRAVVVVVEDDPAYLGALVRMIKKDASDIELVEATTGMDGLLEIGRVQPDLVMLDYSLPDLNAVQVVQRLLDQRKQLTAAVMVVTGGLPASAENELRQVGVRTIVNKSDGIDVVIGAMKRILQARSRLSA